MNSDLYHTTLQPVKRIVKKGLLILCLATTLTVTLAFFQEVQLVSAAPLSARVDRRPDRERPVTTTTEGFSSGSSSQSRPRLIRR